MANRYWRGGTGTWNAASTTNWSTTSGGAGGASAPTASDDVIFDANSFTSASQTVTLGANVDMKSMNWTGVTNTPTLDTASWRMRFYGGDFTLITAMNITTVGAQSTEFWFYGRAGSQTITTANKTLPGYRVEFRNDTSYSGSTFNIVGNLVAAQQNYGEIEVIGVVTLNTNNYNVNTLGAVYADDIATLNLGTSTITIGGDCDLGYNTFSGPNLLTADQATIIMTGTAGYSVPPYFYITEYQTIGNLRFTSGTQACVIYQVGGTVNNLTIEPGTTLYGQGEYGDPTVITGIFTANGTVANPITIKQKQIVDDNVFFTGTPNDPNSNWANDTNAFTNVSTFATATASSTTASNFLQSTGTNQSGSGDSTYRINSVRAKLYINGTGTGNAAIYTSGLAELLGTATSTSGEGSYITLSTPSGGWTWVKLDALTVKLYGSAGLKVSYVNLEVTYEEITTVAMFSRSPSTVRAYNMSLTRAAVTGGATWYAYNSTDSGGNTGWTFANATAYNVNDGGFITA